MSRIWSGNSSGMNLASPSIPSWMAAPPATATISTRTAKSPSRATRRPLSEPTTSSPPSSPSGILPGRNCASSSISSSPSCPRRARKTSPRASSTRSTWRATAWRSRPSSPFSCRTKMRRSIPQCHGDTRQGRGRQGLPERHGARRQAERPHRARPGPRACHRRDALGSDRALQAVHGQPGLPQMACRYRFHRNLSQHCLAVDPRTRVGATRPKSSRHDGRILRLRGPDSDGASMSQTIKAFREAESYRGRSFIPPTEMKERR